MKKIVIALIISILIFVTFIGLLIFKLNTNKDNILDSSNDSSIDFFAMQTHDGFNDTIQNTKYKITNKTELEMFYTLYNGFTLSKDYDLFKNTMFIQTQTLGSGSIKVDFKDVTIDKEIIFNISTSSPEIAVTDDMAYWYLVAIIPNTKLNGVNIEEWKSPIDVNNSVKNEYTITIESTNLDLQDSLNIVEKAVKDIGNIKIQQCHYSPKDNKISYTLISYDEKISKQLIQDINNQKNEVKVVSAFASIKDESEYKNFQETLNTAGTLGYYIDLWSNAINNYTSWRNYS